VAALPCIQRILDANHLTWPDVGHHPDCPFAIFIHASQQHEPTRDLIIDTRRKCRTWLRFKPPDDLFREAWTKRCNEYSIFKPGLVTNKRREGDDHTLRGLAGVYQCRINIIVVSSNHHHTKTTPLQTLVLYSKSDLSSSKSRARLPTLPLHHQDSGPAGIAAGHPAESRRASGATESPNDSARPNPRIPLSYPSPALKLVHQPDPSGVLLAHGR
jgi:hypothetical protein